MLLNHMEISDDSLINFLIIYHNFFKAGVFWLVVQRKTRINKKIAVSMAVMISGFKKAEVPMDRNSAPPEDVPEGIIALGGYANRILIACYIGWLILIAGIYLSR